MHIPFWEKNGTIDKPIIANVFLFFSFIWALNNPQSVLYEMHVYSKWLCNTARSQKAHTENKNTLPQSFELDFNYKMGMA